MKPDLFLVCTEASGDLLGARLLAALKTEHPDLIVAGVGGDKLIAEGMQPTFKVTDFNVMGLVEVLSQLRRLKGMFNQLVEQVKQTKPKAILLIDAPDFNLRFAKAIHKLNLNIPIIYYVSPQVWAWRKKRAAVIAANVDHMMVLFEFEKDIYRDYGLETTWVGHPLVDELKIEANREQWLEEHGLDPTRPLVALAPGSRGSEVRRLLPTMVQVARDNPKLQFAIPLAPTLEPSTLQPLLDNVNIPVLPGQMRPLIAFADAAVVASGTATLETALLRTPMIVGYRMKSTSYWLAKRLVKVPHIALANIVLGARVVPELVQDDFSPAKISHHLDLLLNDASKRQEILAQFDRLPQILGGGGAAQRAAQVVSRYIR